MSKPRPRTAQTLTHYTAGCFTCGASVASRNAVAWAHNHVAANPTHTVEVALGFNVRCEAVG